MAFLGRFDLTVTDRDGVAQTTATHGAYAHVRRQGATVSGAQSGTTPFTVTVNNVGGVVAGDSVAVNAGTTTYFVAAVTSTTIQLTVFAGTLILADDDRLVPVAQATNLYNDATAAESLSFPLSLDANGNATAWCRPGLYDILIAYSSAASNRLIQDFLVHGGEHVFDVSKAPYYAKFDGSTDDYLAITKALNDAVQATWPSQDAVGGVVLLPAGIGMTSDELIIPDRVVMRGQGPYATTIKAHASYVFNGTTDAIVHIGNGALGTDDFNARLEHCTVDGNDIAGSIGVYSASANENCGTDNVQINRCVVKGVFLDTANCQNWRIMDTGIAMSTSASAASAVGIDLGAAVAGSNRIEGCSIGSYSGLTQRMLHCIRARGSATNFSLMVNHCHLEEAVNGLDIVTHNVTAMNLSGLSSTTTVVRVESGVGNVSLQAISKHGATNSLVDSGRSITCTTDLGWYLDGSQADAQFMISDPAVTWQVKNPVQWAGIQKIASTLRLRDIHTVASAATINANTEVGNYWDVTGTTPITAIGDASSNSGRVIWMKFASAGCQVTDNGTTLNLAGNYVSTAGGLLVIACDGTNWNEVSRSPLGRGIAHALSDWNTTAGTETSVDGTDTRGILKFTSSGGGAFDTVLTFTSGGYAAAPTILYTLTQLAGAGAANVPLVGTNTIATTTWTLAVTRLGAGTDWALQWVILE